MSESKSPLHGLVRHVTYFTVGSGVNAALPITNAIFKASEVSGASPSEILEYVEFSVKTCQEVRARKAREAMAVADA